MTLTQLRQKAREKWNRVSGAHDSIDAVLLAALEYAQNYHLEEATALTVPRVMSNYEIDKREFHLRSAAHFRSLIEEMRGG